MTDKEIGLKVVKYFWTWSRSFYGSSFNLSFDAFVQKLASNSAKVNIALDGIGGAVREADLSDSRIETAMRSLAKASNGKIPGDYQVYFKYLSNEATKINWVDAISYTVVESVKDVAAGAQSVGESLITTGKILNFILPLAVLFGLYIFLNEKSGGAVSRTLNSLKK